MRSLIKKANLNTYKKITFFLPVYLLVFYLSVSNCNNVPKTSLEQGGGVLAKKHCNNCHQYPAPQLLDQESWIKHVLPAMAPRLGIKVYGDDQYVNDPSAKSAVSYAEWLKIVEFYQSGSPKILKQPPVNLKALKDWAIFNLKKPLDKVSLAATTMVAFDTTGHHIFTSDRSGNVFQWSDQLRLHSSHQYDSPVVDAGFYKDGKGNEQGLFTFIGSMDAIDIANGHISELNMSSDAHKKELIIADKLWRPIQSIPADFNRDGLTDWVVCEFGHNTGGLNLYTQLKNKSFQKRTIRAVPGPVKAVSGDFNHDGWQDIICLFAHADEGIWMFLNDHKGGFTTKNLLRFPPVYGSSSFQLVDFNNDGKLDILYTSGDNSDYSRVLKPFHGVYIYLNEGGFKFKQTFFYHINGATKAIATDFNGDGKFDIAVIAFFSDLKNNPAEGFTCLEQTEPLQFLPHYLPVHNEGRWICMDVKDYNEDGKPDIILGNFSFGFINQEGVKPDWNIHTPFIVLENISKKSKNKYNYMSIE